MIVLVEAEKHEVANCECGCFDDYCSCDTDSCLCDEKSG